MTLQGVVEKGGECLGSDSMHEDLPFNGDLSSNMRPKWISLIELGEVGLGSHSAESG